MNGAEEVLDSISLKENYQFAKLVKLIELHDLINTEKSHIRKDLFNDFSNIPVIAYLNNFLNFQTDKTSIHTHNTTAVDEYWESSNTIKSDVNDVYQRYIHEIRILQHTFRCWIELRKLREIRKIVCGTKEKIVLIQSAIRRWCARKSFHALEQAKLEKDEAFAAFCLDMKRGVQVDMFSKKYGTLQRRTISFDRHFEKLCYNKSVLGSSTIPCNSIYEVAKGLSGYQYSLATVSHNAWCFHLKAVGDKVLDFSALDANQAKKLYDGFTHLRLLLFTQSPFYIDKEGVPRRAGASVIRQAIALHGPTTTEKPNRWSSKSREKKRAKAESDSVTNGSSSEADHMRHRAALRTLKAEYALWDCALKEEYTAHEKALERAGPQPAHSVNNASSNIRERIARALQEKDVDCEDGTGGSGDGNEGSDSSGSSDGGSDSSSGSSEEGEDEESGQSSATDEGDDGEGEEEYESAEEDEAMVV